MKKINLIQAMGLILGEATNGKIFRVEYVKKDGSIRSMMARTGVKKGVSGKGLKYNPISKALLPVYDMVAMGYRMINFQTIKSLSMNGEKYEVV